MTPRLRIGLLLLLAAIFLVASATHSSPHACEPVISAINREDWVALRKLANPGAMADDSLDQFEKYPLRVCRQRAVNRDFEFNGTTCTKYSFALQFKDGCFHPHWLDIVVREDTDRSEILDFWQYGW